MHDEHKWFEFLILEGAQAGLSWDTILKKRARYREVFAGFDPEKVARYDKKRVRELLGDAGADVVVTTLDDLDLAALGAGRLVLRA